MVNEVGSGPGARGGNDDALERAVVALRNNRPKDAELILADVLRRDPQNSRALYALGCALLSQCRAQDALAPLQAATRIRNDPEIDLRLATALHQTGRSADALSRLKRVVKRHPSFGPAFHELGRLLSDMDRHDEAIEAYRRGVEVSAMMPGLAIELGYALLHRRNIVGAKAAFARELDISANSPDALFGMAKVHQEVGENEAAAAFFRRYLAIRPQDGAAWITFGHCLLELGQVDAGYQCFRTAGRGGPKHFARALSALSASSHGRFWLKPTAAMRYFQGNSE
jgi:Tfp pilus assembly protein PilF